MSCVFIIQFQSGVGWGKYTKILTYNLWLMIENYASSVQADIIVTSLYIVVCTKNDCFSGTGIIWVSWIIFLVGLNI